MRLIITRHGETEENVEGIIQGHMPGVLSELGKKQAKLVAERLKDEKIDHIYSSDLARAADTAREIAKFHPDTPIDFVEELRERQLGVLQGVKKSDIGIDKKKSVSHKPIEGAETIEEMFNRAESFLHMVLDKHKNDTILFVGHNGIDKALLCVIRGQTPADLRHTEFLKNTCINIFEIDEDKNHKMLVFNCDKHLC